jgi:DinB family
MQQSLLQLFQRDIQKLYKEIELYENESKIWEILDGTSNSGGNLALHLMGNLNTYFGKNLGNIGYVRDREAEFSSRNIPKEILLKSIEEVNQVVSKVLENLTDEQMEAIYPENVLGYEMTTEYFLIHLHGHLAYHTGQINYHRRAVNRIF